MLAAALPVAYGLGIDPALLTCDEDNVASRKVIEANGGVFEDTRSGRRRYWVPTSQRALGMGGDGGMMPELREELLRRVEKDQNARKSHRDDWQQVAAVDAENLPWLESLVNEVGWPGRSLVGEDGAHAAWLLVQHAGARPDFQRRCLDLMTQAVERGEATPRDLAYLTDRVLLKEGQAQEYGTQMSGTEGGWVPQNLRDPDNVDARRAAVSLGPLSEYIERIGRSYGRPKPSRLTCRECGGGIDVWLPNEGASRGVRCPACGWETTVTVGPPGPAGRPPGEASR